MKIIFFSIFILFVQEFCRAQLFIGNDTTLCAGQTLTISNTGNPFGTYSWSTGDVNPSITVSESGLYFLDASTNSNVNLISNGNFTNNGTDWSFNGNATEAYAPETSYGGNDFTNVVAEIDWGDDNIAGNGDDVNLSQNVTGLTIGASYQLCFDYVRRDIAPNPVEVDFSIVGIFNQTITSTSNTWVWETFCHTFIAVSNSQTITIIANPISGSGLGMIVDNVQLFATTSQNTESDSILVTFVNPPVVDLGGDLQICETELPIDLNALNSGSTFLWSTGETNGQISVNTGGNYSVTVTDSNNCSTTENILISAENLVDAGNDNLIKLCTSLNSFNLSQLLSINADQGGTWYSTNSSFGGTLINGVLNNFNNETGTASFKYLLQGQLCADDSAYFEVTFDQQPIASADLAYHFCNESANTLNLSNVVLHPYNPIDSIWIMSANLPLLAFDAPSGTFRPENCMKGIYKIQNVLRTSPGSTCIPDTTEITIEISEIPIVQFSSNVQSGCIPFSVLFTDQSSTAGNSIYSWDFGNGNTSSDPSSVSSLYTSADCYDVSLSITSDNLCTASLNLQDMICGNPQPLALLSYSPEIIYEDNPQVSFENNSVNYDSSYWSFGNSTFSIEDNPIVNYGGSNSQNFTVKLIVENIHGCLDSTTALISILKSNQVYVPNTFTPDGNKFNNLFFPVFSTGFDQSNYKLLIYNRWGQVIFESLDKSVGWDGTYDNKIVLDGVYFWKIEYKTSKVSQVNIIQGHVNVLK